MRIFSSSVSSLMLCILVCAYSGKKWCWGWSLRLVGIGLVQHVWILPKMVCLTALQIPSFLLLWLSMLWGVILVCLCIEWCRLPGCSLLVVAPQSSVQFSSVDFYDASSSGDVVSKFTHSVIRCSCSGLRCLFVRWDLIVLWMLVLACLSEIVWAVFWQSLWMMHVGI